jgi:hypothetical protein
MSSWPICRMSNRHRFFFFPPGPQRSFLLSTRFEQPLVARLTLQSCLSTRTLFPVRSILGIHSPGLDLGPPKWFRSFANDREEKINTRNDEGQFETVYFVAPICLDADRLVQETRFSLTLSTLWLLRTPSMRSRPRFVSFGIFR